ncbi:MAG TPA: tetratricopeptide repeat protein [Chthoniobacterales bacterium]|jgi:tetratricopeptide (TPR) repeat protein|nr:tetratricopeptide repeat protein [Chthoniobacterales bacterium]
MPALIPLVRPTKQSRLRATVRRIWKGDWFRGLLLTMAGIVVHAPALQGQRIWDDQYLSHDNPFIKSPLLILEAFRHHLFLDSFSAHYRPIQNVSFIFDYYFWNTDEFGFHLTNTLFHAGSGILLYFLVRQLLASLLFPNRAIVVRQRVERRLPWISNVSFLVAILWIVHPAHSAAVDYISGRADSLAFFFAAAGWLLFLKAEVTARRLIRLPLYGLAATSGLFALLSREIACIWIVLFIAHLLCIEKGVVLRRRLAAVICCIALVGIYAGLRQLPEERSSAPAQAGWSAPVRAMLMARALGDYARLMVYPANLHMERTIVEPGSWQSNADWRRTIGIEYLSVLGLLSFVILAYGACKGGPGHKVRIFGAAWFLVSYLPISNIVQLNATVAEHWLYLPSVGILIFLSGWLIEMPRQWSGVITYAVVIAVIALSARSFIRSGDWSNDETFYKRTLAAGGNSGRVSVNLAQIYARRGDYPAAEKLLREILQSTPDYPTARNTLAAVLRLEGKKAEAETFLQATVRLAEIARHDYPRTWLAALNLAQLRHEAKDDEAALKILEKARASYPNVWDLVSLESELRRVKEGPDAAIPMVEQFLRENWWHHGAAVALGHLYAQKNDAERAEAELRLASRLDVHDAESLRLIALIRVNQKRFDEAVQLQRRAIARQPDQPSQYVFLSNILEKMGRNDEARAALDQVTRLRALAATSPSQSL